MAAVPSPTASARALSADYSGAITVARRAKDWLFLLLFLMLLAQVGIFCLVRYWPEWDGGKWSSLLQYLTAVIDFSGVVLVIVLSLVLLLLVNIMLVGRVVGLERLTSAYLWCLMLGVMLFPWQAVLTSPLTARTPPLAATAPLLPPTTAATTATAATVPSTGPAVPAVEPAAGRREASSSATAPADAGEGSAAANGAAGAGAGGRVPLTPDFKVPGVLYTWAELNHPDIGARFPTTDGTRALLSWSRYAGFPALALVVLLTVQSKSSRGLRMALGEIHYAPGDEATAAG